MVQCQGEGITMFVYLLIAVQCLHARFSGGRPGKYSATSEGKCFTLHWCEVFCCVGGGVAASSQGLSAVGVGGESGCEEAALP